MGFQLPRNFVRYRKLFVQTFLTDQVIIALFFIKKKNIIAFFFLLMKIIALNWFGKVFPQNQTTRVDIRHVENKKCIKQEYHEVDKMRHYIYVGVFSLLLFADK